MKQKELNYMNAIACLCVILIHVLSLGIQAADPSWQAFVIYFPWRLSAFVVPMFLYTGAVKLAMQFQNKTITLQSYKTYIWQRIRKIYLPYVLWVVIYYLTFLPIHYVRGEWRELAHYLITGSITSPFYYIIIIMQFYLLMPLWVWMLRMIPAWLGGALGLLVTLCMRQVPDILSRMGISFQYADRVFATYLIFWVAGLYAGRSYEQAKVALQNKTAQKVCIIVILLYVVQSYLQHKQGLMLFDLFYVKMVADLLSIALVHGLCLRLVHGSERIQRILQTIYESSFFVYLSHCLFLTHVTVFAQGRGVSGLLPLLLIRFLTCYTVPFLLYAVYVRTIQRTKLGHGLLG